jgi:hypothetical protein
MMTPEELERRVTLRTAVERYEELWLRDALTADTAEEEPVPVGAEPLSRAEALELLALGEVIARKAAYGRQLAVRTARASGASWSQLGQALGTSKQAAWETHTRWIEQQERQHGQSGYEGLDETAAARARALAGAPDGADEERRERDGQP